MWNKLKRLSNYCTFQSLHNFSINTVYKCTFSWSLGETHPLVLRSSDVFIQYSIIHNKVFIVFCIGILKNTVINNYKWGTRWRSWFRQCAKSRKVAGSNPHGFIGIFHWYNPSGRTMALGLTQPLTEMSTRNISWGVKAAGVCDWQPYHLQVPIVLKSGSLLEPSGSVHACNGTALTLTKHI